MEQAVRWGSHAEFAARYESFLDAVYGPTSDDPDRSGRWKLARQIASEMDQRGVSRVLDCAAGTGFPGLELSCLVSDRLTIHCSDGDSAMGQVLAARANRLGIGMEQLTAARRPGQPQPGGIEGLVVPWARLNQIEGGYDYILCRGNSLAYADTWDGGRRVLWPDLLPQYLSRIARLLRPGGHLHVDAPWRLGLREVEYELARFDHGHPTSIRERVRVRRAFREWTLSFEEPEGETLRFKRLSSHLTIDLVAHTLAGLGFHNTKPFQLPHEREVYGTIIARKPAKGD